MRRKLVIPKFVRMGIKRNHRSIAHTVKVFGGDTETVDGQPHTLQLCHNGHPDIFYVNKSNILRRFLPYMDDNLVRGEWGVVYFHNLTFDLPVLLKELDIRYWQLSEFDIERGPWKIHVNCEKRFFAKLCLQNHKIVYIVDSFAYLPMSLEKIGKMLLPNLPKLKKPEGLGVLPLRSREFEEYAKRDAVIEEAFGKWIVGIHHKYDVRISVSLPQMASYIFRHKFLRNNDHIALPPKEIVRAALRSYHGGKNGMYVKPGVYENCSEIDLNSAYPYAMKCLPSFLKGEYKRVEKYVPGAVGIYRLSGEVNCPYNIFFDDDFKPVNGFFKDIWVTSYELEQALKYKEVDICECSGYIWEPAHNRNPLGEYVDHFYELKNSTPKTDPMYNFYKLAMNSLYGKFIQAIEVKELSEQDRKGFLPGADITVKKDASGKIIFEKRETKTFKAGGLFHPFIATLITGKVRAMIHELEHKFKALHTATDSIKTLLPMSGETDVLGGYKLEVKGLCILLRNKLYLHFDEKDKLVKMAYHGFQGRAEELLKMISARTTKYTTKRMLKVREAHRLKQEALRMVELSKEFHFDWSNFDGKGFEWWKELDTKTGNNVYFGKLSKRRRT